MSFAESARPPGDTPARGYVCTDMTTTTDAQFHELLNKLAEHYPSDDLSAVTRGYELLCKAEKRESGVEVALQTARVLVDMRLDPPAICAALVARLDLSAEELAQPFGTEVAGLVENVGRLDRTRWDRIGDESAERLRKMFIAMAADIRVVVIALAIRVQRMRALRDAADQTADEQEARRVARESLEIFAPLANRLGIWRLKWELEDLSLRELDPAAFFELQRKLQDTRAERDSYIERAGAILVSKLEEEGIAASVSGRAKHIYSIYRKIQRKGLSFEQIYDISALRVLTGQLGECYAALGVVHGLWGPLPGRFKDYIARPKDNLYQSLHTAVIGPQGKPLEVQIRTHEMHRFADIGVAAHWTYKEGRRPERAIYKKFMVLRQLMDWERELADPHQFVESLRTDVFKDQVYVFTPAGDIVDLPLGATPLDFAYRVHTSIGHRCRGAKVNDAIVPLDHQLKTGDRVEILTHKQESPSRDWINPAFGFLRSNSARTKVRQWFREQDRSTAVEQGRELVEKELSRLSLEYTTVSDVAAALRYDSVDELFAAVGFGDRTCQGVSTTALSLEQEKAPPEEPDIPSSVPADRKQLAPKGLSLGGVDDILGRRAACCNPVPGEPVIGFISRGRGLTIHRRECRNVSREPERLVEIDWGATAGETFLSDVLVRAQDRPGLLRDISGLISDNGVNVTAAQAEARPRDGTALLRLTLEFSAANQVARLLARIAQYPGVLEARRVAR